MSQKKSHKKVHKSNFNPTVLLASNPRAKQFPSFQLWHFYLFFPLILSAQSCLMSEVLSPKRSKIQLWPMARLMSYKYDIKHIHRTGKQRTFLTILELELDQVPSSQVFYLLFFFFFWISFIFQKWIRFNYKNSEVDLFGGS